MLTFDDFTFNILATKNDLAAAFEFMQHDFRVNEPITTSINCTESDTYEFYKDICKNGFKGAYSIIVRDKNGESAGLCLNEINNNLENKNLINNKDETIPNVIDSNTHNIMGYASQNANRINAIIDLVENGFENHMPNAKLCFKINVLGVKKKYMGLGLGKKLVEKSLELAQKNNCDAVYSCTSAKASTNILKKFGFNVVKEIPFDSFLENDKRVFNNLHDGGTGCSLLILDLKPNKNL